jgi:hypothetical protein
MILTLVCSILLNATALPSCAHQLASRTTTQERCTPLLSSRSHLTELVFLLRPRFYTSCISGKVQCRHEGTRRLTFFEMTRRERWACKLRWTRDVCMPACAHLPQPLNQYYSIISIGTPEYISRHIILMGRPKYTVSLHHSLAESKYCASSIILSWRGQNALPDLLHSRDCGEGKNTL